MKCNANGRALIEQFEGCFLAAYLCPAKIWTIGYGHTRNVRAGDTCTQAQADAWLEEDLANVEAGISRLVKKPLTSNQFAALCSLAYNIGLGHFSASSALQLINMGRMDQVPAAIEKWNKINGAFCPGLDRRRRAEAALWSLPDA